MANKLKTYSVTIPTEGYITYLVHAESEEEAREKLEETDGVGLEVQEEGSGDWRPSEEWEIEEVEE